MTMIVNNVIRLLTLMTLIFPLIGHASEHPRLILTKDGVDTIRKNLGQVPLFDASVERVKEAVDAEIALGIDTPIPRDYSGGYTHERHKRNFRTAQQAGALFQILQDEKYARYVRDMLFQYEAMYKDLPVHPKERSYARGKLFWQCLNDSNWLVFMAQAYDAIYTWLSERERQQLNRNLFRPFADFISLQNPKFYNRVHNHSTWGNAAVGMIGLVMNDEELIARALYGIADDGLEAGLKDDDGGFIKVEGQKAGFLANLEEPFSPDGYYTEGPYYQRYAMYPFLIFAIAMHNARPEMKVFEHKDGVLLKAVDALLNLTDADGEFFPLNDGQKGMSYHSGSLVTAVDIAYHYGNRNPQLLSIAHTQNQVLLDQAGLQVAMDIRDGKTQPFLKQSVNLTDGPDGTQGGVGVLRYGDEDLSLVFKYAAQGLSHGHYDKLSYSLYDKGDEVIQDYGLTRFVNIEQKGGGNYLKENKTWAKQTIAHNTLTLNQASHFNGDYATGSQHHSELHFFDASRSDVQVLSARETNAYPGTEMHRTMAMIKSPTFEKPFVLDIMKVVSGTRNEYDLPLYFMGQVMKTNFAYQSPPSLNPLGNKNGYQHLYLEAKGYPASETTQLSWLNQGKFYTLTSSTSTTDELLFARLGANDPDFNLRRDAALIIRRRDTGNTVFASAIEPHGSYSPVSELSVNSSSNISNLKVMADNSDYTAVAIEDRKKQLSVFIVANKDVSASKRHKLKIGQQLYRWKGPYHFAIEE
ncbi:alginate lyase family protein [Pseudomaricurvus alkylphenolicus]|uniref:heparinase II/III domain-containing protein n=1 Tax=Pseudomaricurvus alkylphenolicus TaxID=1306991 RepID=UPI00141F9A80|nr:heparinase II/III family protein [Pseudomaricurvus alkylphenolicus]NIB42548.1 alginate lyase family protein [Pseudomaricurvus alkylphenolicus]